MTIITITKLIRTKIIYNYYNYKIHYTKIRSYNYIIPLAKNRNSKIKILPKFHYS